MSTYVKLNDGDEVEVGGATVDYPFLPLDSDDMMLSAWLNPHVLAEV